MGILISALTIFFQNCSKIKQGALSNSGDKITVIGKIQTTEPVRVIGNYDPVDPGRGPVAYWIHANGQVDKGHLENPQAPAPTVCTLNSHLLTQLNAALESSQICFYETQAPEGAVCTLQYVYPYFLVNSDDVLYEFGKLTSGCGDTFEMCGAARSTFKTLVESIATELDHACN